MEEKIINHLQYKLEQDGEDDLDYKKLLEEDVIQFDESNLQNQDERLVEYSENLQELCVYALIFCLTNILVLIALKSKKVNFNQIFGVRANSQMVENVMWLMICYCGYIVLQYLSSLLEQQNISNFCFVVKYINLILMTVICKRFYNKKMKEDGIFFLSQIKYQKDISFIMVFISDQLLTLAPFIMKHIYLINFLLRVDIPIYKFQVYGLAISKLIRIYQCIKLFQADPFKNKDLLSNVEIQNCIKYLVSLMCTVLDQFLVYRISVDCGLLISHVCYSIYTYYWDVYEDWQLNIKRFSYFSSEEFKNRKPLFNYKFYIFSLIFNGLVRLNWAIKYFFSFNHYEVDYYVYCFEISRRSLWNLLKLDCEQYLLKEKSEQKMKGNEVELSSISTSVKIIIDENSPIKQSAKDDKRNN
ncbi:hypothetical protein ABPG72_013087 [Tetrahymena utriculariae]